LRKEKKGKARRQPISPNSCGGPPRLRSGFKEPPPLPHIWGKKECPPPEGEIAPKQKTNQTFEHGKRALSTKKKKGKSKREKNIPKFIKTGFFGAKKSKEPVGGGGPPPEIDWFLLKNETAQKRKPGIPFLPAIQKLLEKREWAQKKSPPEFQKQTP